jgi:hypothetical protein
MELLPNLLPSALIANSSIPERRVEPRGRVLLHGGRDMAVQVESHADCGVPEALLRYFGMHLPRPWVDWD